MTDLMGQQITPCWTLVPIQEITRQPAILTRAMVLQTDTNRVMDELWELGARAILVTSIHACRI